LGPGDFHGLRTTLVAGFGISLSRYVDIAADEVLELLAHMPSLVTLDIELGECVNSILLNGLCYGGTNGYTLIPKLENLSIEGVDEDDITDYCLANMVESRWQTDGASHGPSTLKNVDLYFHGRRISPGLREWMEECRQEGLLLRRP